MRHKTIKFYLFVWFRTKTWEAWHYFELGKPNFISKLFLSKFYFLFFFVHDSKENIASYLIDSLIQTGFFHIWLGDPVGKSYSKIPLLTKYRLTIKCLLLWYNMVGQDLLNFSIFLVPELWFGQIGFKKMLRVYQGYQSKN